MAGDIAGWVYLTGLRRGMLRRSWPWFVVALAARILRGELQREERAVISMDLTAGDRLSVSARKPEPKG